VFFLALVYHVPPGSWTAPVVISTNYQNDFPPLSSSVLRGPALLPTAIPKKPRRALRPAAASLRRRRQAKQIRKNSGSARPSAFELPQKAFKARDCSSYEMAARRDHNLHPQRNAGRQPPLSPFGYPPPPPPLSPPSTAYHTPGASTATQAGRNDRA
jgi:hypothetical protein